MACVQRFTTTVVLTSLMATGGLAHAENNASIIYAAENALYGAGYQIGQADGWMDRELRSAIREYQGAQEDLTANGTLDAQTLEALGIDYSPAMAISENHLGSPKAVRLALNLPVADTPPTKPTTVNRPVAQPEPSPEPAAIAAEPVEPEQPPAFVAQTPEPDANNAEAMAPVAQAESTKAPAPEMAVAESADTEEQAPQPGEQEIQIIAKDDDPIRQLPTEPTSAGVAESTQAEAAPVSVTKEPPASMATAASTSLATVSRDRSSGFLASLFDFLFGWLI